MAQHPFPRSHAARALLEKHGLCRGVSSLSQPANDQGSSSRFSWTFWFLRVGRDALSPFYRYGLVCSSSLIDVQVGANLANMFQSYLHLRSNNRG